MANKLAILENVDMYSADELVEYIKEGVVTFQELCDETEGCFSAKVRKEVQKKLQGSEEEDWNKAVSQDTHKAYLYYQTMYPCGKHAAEAERKIIKFEEEIFHARADQAWDNVDKDSIEDLRRFCDDNPQNPHVNEARRRINELSRETYIGYGVKALLMRINQIQSDKNVLNKPLDIYNTIVDFLRRGKVTQNDLLDMIQDDHNVLRAPVVNKLLDSGHLSYEGLESIGIDKKFIMHLLREEEPQGFAIPRNLDHINTQSTEVYFWGIPSSGKSCALGAILSVAGNGKVARSMSKDNDCQGYGYMNRLAALFRSTTDVSTLPEGTSIYSTYEMGFDLEDLAGVSHPLTCIDLAGELVRCMYKSDAGEPMTDDELEALETLTNVLIDNRTKNRKIHFFVLEYGAEDRMYEGLTQSVYLEGALRYIERYRIFNQDTDAIYLMISKVDKAKAPQGQLADKLKQYIRDYYLGFYNGLRKICGDCEINNGVVEIVPFTLGEVCFQDYCLFNGTAATNVVRKLMERSKGFGKGKIDKVRNTLRR